MKRIYAIVVFTILTTIAYAQADDKGYQEGAWVLKGVTGLNMSQTAMSNWSAGGENSIAGNAYLNASLTHKKGNWLWVSNVVLIMDCPRQNHKELGKVQTKSEFQPSWAILLIMYGSIRLWEI